MKTTWIFLASLFLASPLCPVKYATYHPVPENVVYKFESFTRAHFFSLFVGHGGNGALEHASKTIPDVAKEFFRSSDIKKTLKTAFIEADETIREDDYLSGCDAMIAFANEDTKQLTIAHVGSCRAVASADGIAMQLSDDHTITNKKEFDRIENAGGFLAFGKVMGSLDATRALGDGENKWAEKKDHTEENYLISPIPEIEQYTLQNIEFLIIANKDVWDTIDNQGAIDILRSALRTETNHNNVVKTFINNLPINKLNTEENPAIILIVFGDPSEWKNTEKKRHVSLSSFFKPKPVK